MRHVTEGAAVLALAVAIMLSGCEGQAINIQVEGKNGSCGPVMFQADNLPEGVSFRVPVAFTGQSVPFEVRAGPGARAMQGGSFVLFGHASGASSGSLQTPRGTYGLSYHALEGEWEPGPGFWNDHEDLSFADLQAVLATPEARSQQPAA